MLSNLTLILAIMSTALIAGLYYSYSCSVNPGLGNLGNRDYLIAMQSINRAILNPAFFASFIGTLILLPLAAWLNCTSMQSPRFLFLLAATLVYAIASFGLTVFGNVPLNEMLETVNPDTMPAKELEAFRLRFEPAWNQYHTIRTFATILSLLLSVLSVFDWTSKG